MIKFLKDALGSGGEIADVTERYSMIAHATLTDYRVFGYIVSHCRGASFKRKGSNYQREFKNTQEAIRYGLKYCELLLTEKIK